MQFELSARDLDATRLAAALRPLDPDAHITLDAARGRMQLESAL